MTATAQDAAEPRPEEPPAPSESAGFDPEALEQYLGHVGAQLAAAVNANLVALGDALGLWSGLADAGKTTPGELATLTGLSERLVREWLAAQTANGFIRYDAEADRFWMTPEAAMVLADPDSPASMLAPFQGLAGITASMPALASAFRTGSGLAWQERTPDFFETQYRLGRSWQEQFLVGGWLAAVPGLVDALTAGARVADVGCGYGNSTILMAQAFPASTFTGFDFHDASVAQAREAATGAGVADRVTFEVAEATAFQGTGYDLVLMVDCLHDMGDPVAAARHARSTLAPSGVLVTLDPVAIDGLAANVAGNPMAGLLYAVSTFLCVPTAMAQNGADPVGLAPLGAQSGPEAIKQVLRDAGFTDVQHLSPELPLNMVIAGRG